MPAQKHRTRKTHTSTNRSMIPEKMEERVGFELEASCGRLSPQPKSRCNRGHAKWRRGWDSNPRYGFPHARFRGEYFKPLSHLSAAAYNSILTRRCFSSNYVRG